jgi:hypothetical protein
MGYISASMAEGTQCCETCKEIKPYSTFEVFSPNKYRMTCKICYNKKRADAYKSTPKAPPDLNTLPSQCVKCGKPPSDEIKFVWRGETRGGKGSWRNECMACTNKKGYSAKSRAKKRAEDEPGYLARNAATHLDWAHRNPDKVKEQQMMAETEPDRKLKALITSAKQREIPFSTEDSTTMLEKFQQACDYCGFIPTDGESLNGLDRVDNGGGYTDANTVPCCGACNFMKQCSHVDDFLSASRKIFFKLGLSEISPDTLPSRTKSLGGHKERDGKSKDHKVIELTFDERMEIMSSPCYLCGAGPSFGIDRLDSSICYSIENSKPCCWICNGMKKDLHIDVFKKHVAAIVSHTSTRVLSDVSHLPLPHLGTTRQPIGFYHASGEKIIFPGVTVAADMCRKCWRTINRATLSNHPMWHVAHPSEYRSQNLDKEIVLRIIREINNQAR